MEKKKDIADYLHLYLGCEAITDSGITGELITINHEAHIAIIRINLGIGQTISKLYTEIKPILRPLSDMTEEEAKFLCGWVQAEREILGFRKTEKFAEISYRWKDNRMDDGWAYSSIAIYFDKEEWTPEQFQYLLSLGFDLFNLIPDNLAIDNNTL